MKRLFLCLCLLICAFLGCGSNLAILSWKPTTVVVKDNTSGHDINATASPTQPTDIHDISGDL